MDLSIVEVLQKVLALSVLSSCWMKYLFHDLLNHFILLFYVTLLTLQLRPQLLILYEHLIKLLLE